MNLELFFGSIIAIILGVGFILLLMKYRAWKRRTYPEFPPEEAGFYNGR